jgi:hypothetical protein
MVMITLRSAQGAPTVEDIERRFGLSPDQIDRRFGVVETDDSAHEYTILVDESAVPRIRSTEEWSVSGPYANPPISTFGPPGSGR